MSCQMIYLLGYFFISRLAAFWSCEHPSIHVLLESEVFWYAEEERHHYFFFPDNPNSPKPTKCGFLPHIPLNRTLPHSAHRRIVRSISWILLSFDQVDMQRPLDSSFSTPGQSSSLPLR
jgi:hypothetical protein